MPMRICKLLLVTYCAILLQSCFFVAGAAAGAAAVAIVNDKRSIELMLADQQLASKIAATLKTTPELANDTNINVTSFGKVVLLTGQVPNAASRQEAQHLTQTIPGIKRIYNGLSIQKPIANLVHASDSWLTTKVKTAFLTSSGLNSVSIKVVTEDSSVYLLGTATSSQAQLLCDIAAQINGVKHVVAILQTTSSDSANLATSTKVAAPQHSKDNEVAVINEVPS